MAPSWAWRAHLIVQAHEAQGVANTFHLVQDIRAQDHGCEGDGDGAAAPCRDHLTRTVASVLLLPMALVLLPPSAAARPPPRLTTCLGLMQYRWSAGTPSCSRRMTEMNFCETLLLTQELSLAVWTASWLESEVLEGLGDEKELLLSGVSGHKRSFPAWSRSGKGGP